jgi:phospholipase C
MTVISPWSTGGWVCSETFDHTSIIRFLEARFGVHESNITPWRRAVCGDLASAFDFDQTRTDVPPLPATAAYRPADDQRHPDYAPVPPTNPMLPGQTGGWYDVKVTVENDVSFARVFAGRVETGHDSVTDPQLAP